MTEYELIDQQWVPDEPTALRVKDRLLRAAVSQGMVIGVRHAGREGGYFVTVEKEITQ